MFSFISDSSANQGNLAASSKIEKVEITISEEKSNQTFEMNQIKNKHNKKKKKKRRKRPNMDFLFNSPPIFQSNVDPERNRESFENQVRIKCEKVDIRFEYQAGKFDHYLDKDQNIEVT